MPEYRVITKKADKKRKVRDFKIHASCINEAESQVEKTLEEEEYIYDILALSSFNSMMDSMSRRSKRS
tara:strand:+ start:3343 stop:3546 length:204 start_codon:yes stop_codon:yes gene_type:complete